MNEPAGPPGRAPAVTVEEAIRSRRSIRAFLPTPVPPEHVEEILALATRAPSGNNTQPWKVYVVQGEARDALSRAVLEARESEPWPEREYHYTPSPLPEPYRTRSRTSGRALYELAGVPRGDREAHHAQQRRNYLFFGAPVGLFFFMDRFLLHGSWLDCGMFIQNVMLAARARGLDTCAQGAWANFHPLVRAHVGAGEEELLICGMSLGYADPVAPVNRLETEREPLERFVRWRGR